MTDNAALLIRQWQIAGLPGPLRAEAMNGSLWTLYYEAVCYLGIGVLVAFGVLGRASAPRGSGSPAPVRRHGLLVTLTILAWLIHTLQSSGVVGRPAGVPAPIRRALPSRSAGTRLRAPGSLPHCRRGAAAITLAASLAFFEQYRPLGAVPFAYLVLWLMVALPVRGEPGSTLSYGMYVYHWPIVLVLAELGFTSIGRVAFTLVAFAITATVAVISWHLVEAPALRRKNVAWVEHRPSARRRLARRGSDQRDG